jgi:hypothetical protein
MTPKGIMKKEGDFAFSAGIFVTSKDIASNFCVPNLFVMSLEGCNHRSQKVEQDSMCIWMPTMVPQ